MTIPETITALLEPVVASLGVELVDVEWNGNSLRIVVDRLWGDDEVADKKNGVTTQQLASVNRMISPILDQHDPIPGRYTLEVSSPGVERKLGRPEHFTRAIGEDVVIKMNPESAPRRVKGPLVAFDPDRDVITVWAEEIDGIDQTEPNNIDIELVDVEKARTSFSWGPTPKKGGSAKGKKKASPKQKAQRAQQDQKTESKTEE